MSDLENLPPQLRQQFYSNVLGPIGHHIVVNTVEHSRDALSSHLHNPLTFNNYFSRLLGQDLLDKTTALNEFVNGVRRAISFSSRSIQDIVKFPLTKTQVNLSHFLQEGKQGFAYRKDGHWYFKREGSFTVEANSILRALQDLAFRTAGLTIASIDDFIAFARRPELPSVIRNIMAGGPDFDTFLRARIGEPAPRIFRELIGEHDPLAFVNDQGVIEINPAIIELRNQFNRSINLSEDHAMGANSLPGKAAGCPLKNLTFMQHTALLDGYGANLTNEQIELLISGDNPTATKFGRVNVPNSKGIYVIKRDAIAETLTMCIHEMEKVKDIFEERLISDPDNEYLIGNLGLIGWQDLVLATSSSLQLSRVLTGPK